MFVNFSFKVARRYLFARKSTNAINIISGISVFGITIGTAALVLVLSVFNGFEDLITGLFGAFNPDVKVLPAEGKTFLLDTSQIADIRNLPAVAFVSTTIEETAFFEHKESQDFGILKGVDSNYQQVVGIDSAMREGRFALWRGQQPLGVLGVGMRNRLSVNTERETDAVHVYMAKRKRVGPLEKPFKQRLLYPVGAFSIQQDFDNEYIVVPLSFVQELLGAQGEVSALEIRLSNGANTSAIISVIKNILGEGFLVKSRYEQDEAFLRLMNIEKWMSFAILCLTLVLVAFNMIGSLWMIVLDKRQDIAVLKSMGATTGAVRNIFLYEGLLLCGLGLLTGFVLAVGFYAAQKAFGIVPIPAGFVVDAYPMSMRWFDLVAVGITVLVIGFLASVPAALRAARIPAMIRED